MNTGIIENMLIEQGYSLESFTVRHFERCYDEETKVTMKRKYPSCYGSNPTINIVLNKENENVSFRADFDDLRKFADYVKTIGAIIEKYYIKEEHKK